MSVMTALTRLTPRRSMVVEKRIVSPCTRCEAPSIWRRHGQFAM